jgi:hypothetical protein
VRFERQLIAVTEKAEEQYKKRLCNQKELELSQRELFCSPHGDAVPPNLPTTGDRTAKVSNESSVKPVSGNSSEAMTLKDNGGKTDSYKTEPDDSKVPESEAKKDDGKDNESSGDSNSKVSEGELLGSTTVKKKQEHLESNKSTDADGKAVERSAKEGDGGDQRAKDSEVGDNSSEGVGTSKSPSEEAVAYEGEQKENKRVVEMEIGTPTASGGHKISMEEDTVVQSPTHLMYGPFKPGALQTPVSSTSSESPPPINPKRGIKHIDLHRGPLRLSFPGGNTTDGGEEDDDDDDDEDDDNDDDDDDNDNIDPEAIRKRKKCSSLGKAAVQYVHHFLFVFFVFLFPPF